MGKLGDLYRRYVLGENYYSHGNILLEQHRLVYFPIPKVACSSIKKVLADLLGLPCKADNVDDAVHDLHFPFARRQDLIDGKYHDYFRFAVVRNPWDRLYSCYCSKILQDPAINGDGWINGVFGGFDRYGPIFYATMTFEEFVDAVAQIPDDEADEHFRSQYVTIEDDTGNFLPDHIGRLEEIDKTWEMVQKQIGLTIALPRLMVSNRRDYHDVYNDELIDKVRRRYARDIERFAYSFDGVQQPDGKTAPQEH